MRTATQDCALTGGSTGLSPARLLLWKPEESSFWSTETCSASVGSRLQGPQEGAPRACCGALTGDGDALLAVFGASLAVSGSLGCSAAPPPRFCLGLEIG